MGKIVTIGGGDTRKEETKSIDIEIIKLTKKKRPKLLFIPTASSDSEDYWKTTDRQYTKLGAKTDVLYLIRDKPSSKVIREKILDADIIYVGGGNTLKMMRLWRHLGVDKLLKQVLQKGTVLTGLSAGSICWYDSGHSDSMSFYNPKKWKYIKVRGLGLIKGIHCPHYDSSTLGVKREKHFQKMIKEYGGLGIAIDNNCAIEYVDDTYRVIASEKSARAYRVYKRNGRVVSEEIKKTKEFLPISKIYDLH